MDAVELARQTAAELHAKAVAAGADPWKPYTFVIAVALSLGLEIDPVQPGSAVLNGARAIFDPASRSIIHEFTGDDFHHALLIGHELGHATLGDDRIPDQVLAVDPARSAEAAPVGEERVVDYNRRQRREVQMDLFGRELILPRSWARELHLGGLTASQIAERLGAPFDAVAQQLLDALLLPPVTATEAKPKPEKPLNPEQKDAAEHLGAPYLLEAGPGTGKTQTLVARTRFLVVDREIDPREILVLTFSNKAAGELSDRIATLRPEAAAAMWIGTFHAFGLDLVRRFHKELGFAREPRMMDRPEAVELLEAEFTQLGLVHYRNLWDPSQVLRELLNAVSRAKDEVADDVRYAELAEMMRHTATTDEAQIAAAKAGEVARAYAAYERVKREAGAVDFGDLVALPVKLLTEHPKVAERLRETYRHILVDEYQDVNRASVRLLQLITDKGRNLWAVGDARQSIYRFRGASSFNMARFAAADFQAAQTGRLKVNYRSVEEIVDAYSAFGRDMSVGNGPADLKADRGLAGVNPAHLVLPTTADEAAGLAETLQAEHVSGRRWRDQAVLCKGNERLARLGAELEQLGIPILFLGSLFERPEIKDLLAWLSLLVDRRAMGLARHKAPKALNAPLSDVAAILAHLKSAEHPPLAWLQMEAIPGVSASGMQTLKAMAVALQDFRREDAPWPVLARLLLDRTRIAADVAEAEGVAGRAKGLAIWQFMNFLRVQPGGPGLPISRLLGRIRRLVLLADERDLRQLPLAAQEIDAVRLMTIHGSKGLEFETVHILGLNKAAFPWKAPAAVCPPPDGLIEGAAGSGLDAVAADQAQEQECLFYVGLSRARDRLFLYSAAATTANARRDPSPYLARLDPWLTHMTLTPGLALPPTEDTVPIAVRFEGALSFRETQLELYDRCPRRFFYTHVLDVGGRRTATAFMEMHDIVQEVVGTLSQRSPEDADDIVVAEVFAVAFDGHKLAEHGYAADFRAIAQSLVGYFADSRRGKTTTSPDPLRLAVAGGEIVVTPDEVLIDDRGQHAVRRIRSGHRPSRAKDGLAAAAFQLAAVDAFPGCRVELVYLADAETTPIEFKRDTLERRRGKVVEALRDIGAGAFPMKDSSFVCPRCPAFFICGPVAQGPFEKKF